MKLIVNNTLSLSKINNNQIIIYQDNNFKSIDCDFDILNNILNLIDKYGRMKEVYDEYEDNFSKEEIDGFLNVLKEEKIILTSENIKKEKAPSILLFSDEQMENNILKCFSNEINIIKTINNIQDLKKEFDFSNYDCVFLAKSNLKYEEGIWINNKLVKANIPFIMLRYDGENIISGPFIFPNKGACYQCNLEHHVDKLNENENVSLDLNCIQDLYMTKTIDFDIFQKNLDFCLDKIKNDILKLKKDKVNFYYFQKEEILNVKTMEIQTCMFYPTTSCNCCNGMTNKLINIDDIDRLSVPVPIKLFEDDDKEIKYTKGGIRSVTAEDTQKIINKALDKIKIDINLERINNKFERILPVYRANIDVAHKNSTPYFFQYQRSFGKGITEQQALFSCTFELMERLSSHYYGDIPLIRATPKKIEKYRIDIETTTNQIPQIYDRYEDFNSDKTVDWIWGQSLVDGKVKLIPASRVFLTGVKFKGDYVPVGSSGLSAGATLEDAILQGLFEIIEHDAWCIGQSNRTKLPIIDYSTVKKETTKKLIEDIEKNGFKIISRDYTTDIGIPTIRTWIIDENNYIEYATNGFGTSIDPEIALERSITEAVQGKLPPIQSKISEYGRKNLTGLINSRDSIFNLGYFKIKDMDINTEKLKSMNDFEKIDYNTVKEVLEYVVFKVNKATSGDVLFTNLTNENLGGIPAVKVIVTGNIQIVSEPLLCPSERMLNFNKIMGYSQNTSNYSDLFLGDYPH